jgi:ubiquitin thioesterase protein OTUB1
MSAPNDPPPPAGAQDDAATQQSLPRVIDENTDMSTLTDQEIMRLMEGMDHNEDVMSKVSPGRVAQDSLKKES